uniref:Uncharacterized protein n=1 Tax=Lygus hesperus TaxID=30085 RepID=A0A0A9W6G9_LYGHE
MFDYLVFLFEETTRITSAKESEPLELLYAQDLMDCLESTSSHLAEFESLEVMVFITEKILDPKKEVSVDIMFRCLYTVALSYKNRFPIPMYKPLLYLISDYPTTEMGQIIFHTLLDVHGNLTTVDLPSYNILLRNKPYCRGNMLLIRTYDLEIYAAVLKALEAADFVKSSHSKTVYRTLLAMGAYQEPSTILNYIACMYLLQSLAVRSRQVVDRESRSIHRYDGSHRSIQLGRLRKRAHRSSGNPLSRNDGERSSPQIRRQLLSLLPLRKSQHQLPTQKYRVSRHEHHSTCHRSIEAETESNRKDRGRINGHHRRYTHKLL